MSSFSDKGLLGELEQLVMMAIIRLGNEAHAPAVVEEIQERTKMSFSRGTVFVVLDRLDRKAYLRSRFSEPTPERGGKPKRLFSLTSEGRKALADAHRVIERMKPVPAEKRR